MGLAVIMKNIISAYKHFLLYATNELVQILLQSLTADCLDKKPIADSTE